MKTIDFSDEELNALIQLIDIAVKAQGLGVAQAAVILADKVRAAAAPPTTVDDSPQFADSIEATKEDLEEDE